MVYKAVPKHFKFVFLRYYVHSKCNCVYLSLFFRRVSCRIATDAICQNLKHFNSVNTKHISLYIVLENKLSSCSCCSCWLFRIIKYSLLNEWVLSIGQNLQPYTGNGDVSKWVKNSRMGQKKYKQTTR